MNRRTFVAAGLALPAIARGQEAGAEPKRKGRLKQCVTQGVFGRGMPFEEMARQAARLGAYGFDLIGPDRWPVLKKYGLVPTMMPPPYGGTIPDGINEKANHQRIERTLNEAIDLCAAHGAPNVIALSGSRRGMPDAKGADNSVELLNKVKAHAEDKGVTICLELLNSKVDHKDYMCDRTSWGVEVCRRVNSPRVKLLYDIYHMQIMEGDVVRTVRANIGSIAHFHTGGNPGRHEIDQTQELNYHFVAQAIADLGFDGQIAHEYGPAQGRDPIKSLEQAMEICDV